MEKILEKIESMLENQFTAFEEKPIKTSIKFLIFYWLAKTVYKEIRDDVAEFKASQPKKV